MRIIRLLLVLLTFEATVALAENEGSHAYVSYNPIPRTLGLGIDLDHSRVGIFATDHRAYISRGLEGLYFLGSGRELYVKGTYERRFYRSFLAANPPANLVGVMVGRYMPVRILDDRVFLVAGIGAQHNFRPVKTPYLSSLGEGQSDRRANSMTGELGVGINF